MNYYKIIRNISMLVLLGIGVAHASTEDTMKKMSKALSGIEKADNSQSFVASADKLISAAKESLLYVPSKLDGMAEEKQKDYKAGLQSIIDVTSQAKMEAEKGDLKSAKETIKKLYSIRSEYHGRYK